MRLVLAAAFLAASACVPTIGATREEQAAAIDSYLRGIGFHGAVLVVRSGEVLLDEAYGWSHPSEKTESKTSNVYAIASITKTFTAAAVMKLVGSGQLQLDDRIAEHVPELAIKPWHSITVEQLLSHTSGAWRTTGAPEEVVPLEEAVARNEGVPLVCSPGKCFNYSNMGYEVLGLLIERVDGRDYATFLEEEFFVPLSMRDTGAAPRKRASATEALGGVTVNGTFAPTLFASEAAASAGASAGGVYSTTADLYRWLDALLSDRVLPEAVFDEMTKPQTESGQSVYQRYGFGWQVLADSSAFWHTGAIWESFSSLLFYDRGSDLAIVLVSNDYANAGRIEERLVEFQQGVRLENSNASWLLPLGAVLVLLAAGLASLRLVAGKRDQTRMFRRPDLRRFALRVALPALIAFGAWGIVVLPLLEIGALEIAFAVVPVWQRALMFVAALYVLLTVVVVSGFLPKRAESP